jgi:hypothetical protein
MIGNSCMIHILAFHGHATQNYLKSKTLSYHAAQTRDDHVMLTVRTGKKKDYTQALIILNPPPCIILVANETAVPSSSGGENLRRRPLQEMRSNFPILRGQTKISFAQANAK